MLSNHAIPPVQLTQHIIRALYWQIRAVTPKLKAFHVYTSWKLSWCLFLWQLSDNAEIRPRNRRAVLLRFNVPVTGTLTLAACSRDNDATLPQTAFYISGITNACQWCCINPSGVQVYICQAFSIHFEMRIATRSEWKYPVSIWKFTSERDVAQWLERGALLMSLPVVQFRAPLGAGFSEKYHVSPLLILGHRFGVVSLRKTLYPHMLHFTQI